MRGSLFLAEKRTRSVPDHLFFRERVLRLVYESTPSNYALTRTVREEVSGAIMRCGQHDRLA